MFSCILGLYPPESSWTSWIVITKSVSRSCQMSQEQRDKSVPGSESLELGLDGTSYPWGLSIKTHTLVSRSDDSGDVGMAGNKAMIMVIWCIPSYELLGCWTSYCWLSRALGDGMNIRIPVCLSFIFRDNIVPVFLYYEKLFINSLVWICRVGYLPGELIFQPYLWLAIERLPIDRLWWRKHFGKK